MRTAACVLATLALVVLVAACAATPGGSSTSPTTAAAIGSVPSGIGPTPGAKATEPAVASPVDAQPAATPVGTTQTPWGRILDAVPSTFPVFPDATVADPPSGGAVSGAWVAKASVGEVAAWYHDALLAANWAKVDDGGGLEDGSHVLDVQGDLPECRAQVTTKPFGGSTMITVLLGAGCVGGDG
jgi:hypothetical protein